MLESEALSVCLRLTLIKILLVLCRISFIPQKSTFSLFMSDGHWTYQRESHFACDLNELRSWTEESRYVCAYQSFWSQGHF